MRTVAALVAAAAVLAAAAEVQANGRVVVASGTGLGGPPEWPHPNV
jgi:hypothetical protein